MAETELPFDISQFEPKLNGVDVRDRSSAAANLARIFARVPPSVAESIIPLLSDCPDPDSALNLFERLVGNSTPELFRAFLRHPFLVHYALLVFGYSEWLGETLIQNPDLFHSMLRDRTFGLSHSREDYAEAFARFRSMSMESDIALLLARFKRREYVRIMLRDVLGIATLAEVSSEISALSDVLIEQAYRYADMILRNRYGAPQHYDSDHRLADTPFAILSLGKLGGNELNYSSDIDLLFLHGDGTEPASAPISNHEYFVRLAQEITATLSRMTPEGSPFRIDLRLRPQGREGDTAVALAHATDYYVHRAEDWELQALIKVRYSAGHEKLARKFISSVRPFVYTEQLNFAAVETAVESREKMIARRKPLLSVGGTDIKTDRGGIRDIEFLVQCLQRVYGGKETWLRSGGTLFSLAKLHDKEHISGKEFHLLTTSYEFLRQVEHRLQLRHGQQTHRIPKEEHELRILNRSVHRQPQVSGDRSLTDRLHDAMGGVAEIYQRIIHSQQKQRDREIPIGPPAPSFGLIGREHDQKQVIERLADDSPRVLEMVRRDDLDLHTRRNLLRFMTAVSNDPALYAWVSEHTKSLHHALKIFRLSEYLSDILIRYPEHIRLLDNPSPSSELSTSAELSPLGVPGVPISDPQAELRRKYRASVFELSASHILKPGCVYSFLEHISRVGEDAIRAAWQIVGAPEGLAVMALGRLGTREADVLSDADLLFVREAELDEVTATRAAERLVQCLSAYTRDGIVMSVDTRLRPSGGEGELVVTPTHLERYFLRDAHAWEALAYSKLRYIAGSRQVGKQASDSRRTLFQRFSNDKSFAVHLRELRTKLDKTRTDPKDLKTGPGGLYDVDYIIGYLMVNNGTCGERGNLRDCLLDLIAGSALGASDGEVLLQSTHLMKTVEHAIRIVMGRAARALPESGAARHAIEELALESLGRASGYRDLEAVIQRSFNAVRAIYNRVLQ